MGDLFWNGRNHRIETHLTSPAVPSDLLSLVRTCCVSSAASSTSKTDRQPRPLRSSRSGDVQRPMAGFFRKSGGCQDWMNRTSGAFREDSELVQRWMEALETPPVNHVKITRVFGMWDDVGVCWCLLVGMSRFFRK